MAERQSRKDETIVAQYGAGGGMLGEVVNETESR